MEQFQAVMDKVVAKALKESTLDLGKEVSGCVSETVLKEMNYLMRMQDEKEEERYKKLDEVMRSRQHMSRKERKQKLKAEKMLLKKSKKQEKSQDKKQVENVAAKGVKKEKERAKVTPIATESKVKNKNKKMGIHIGKKIKTVTQ